MYQSKKKYLMITLVTLSEPKASTEYFIEQSLNYYKMQ